MLKHRSRAFAVKAGEQMIAFEESLKVPAHIRWRPELRNLVDHCRKMATLDASWR